MKYKKSDLTLAQGIAILMALIAFLMIMLLINQTADQAEGRTAEAICRGSVAARIQTTAADPTGITDTSMRLFPLLCKTLDITTPQKPIPENQEVNMVLKDIADHAAKTWWMFGEGAADSVFGVQAPFGKDDCMITYITKVEGIGDKVIEATKIKEFLASTPYFVEDGSDGCMNYGGYCVEKDTSCKAGWKSKEENSICEEEYANEDQKKSKCCFHRYGCFNKGGECIPGGCKSDKDDNEVESVTFGEIKIEHVEEGEIPNNGESYRSTELIEVKTQGWECPGDQSCCVDTEKRITYNDYIQKYNYDGTVIVDDTIEIADKDLIAIAYVSQKVTPFWPESWFKEGAEYTNRIIISDLKKISASCAIQEDIGGK